VACLDSGRVPRHQRLHEPHPVGSGDLVRFTHKLQGAIGVGILERVPEGEEGVGDGGGVSSLACPLEVLIRDRQRLAGSIDGRQQVGKATHRHGVGRVVGGNLRHHFDGPRQPPRVDVGDALEEAAPSHRKRIVLAGRLKPARRLGVFDSLIGTAQIRAQAGRRQQPRQLGGSSRRRRIEGVHRPTDPLELRVLPAEDGCMGGDGRRRSDVTPGRGPSESRRAGWRTR
jgi:hypothetical protein